MHLSEHRLAPRARQRLAQPGRVPTLVLASTPIKWRERVGKSAFVSSVALLVNEDSCRHSETISSSDGSIAGGQILLKRKSAPLAEHKPVFLVCYRTWIAVVSRHGRASPRCHWRARCSPLAGPVPRAAPTRHRRAQPTAKPPHAAYPAQLSVTGTAETTLHSSRKRQLPARGDGRDAASVCARTSPGNV